MLGRRISAGQVSAALEDLAAISVLCTDPTDPPRVLRDPNDDYLLALAASAGAQAIVTGDRACLSITTFTRRRSQLVRLSSGWGSHSTARRPGQVHI
ncbi:MAG: PIN domain-containing protein [Trebonia sp.]